ncbi:hypothetical protein U1Q18_003456 [Sarracenia purpurea var. burkii]
MMKDESMDKDFVSFLRTEAKSFTSLKGLSPIKGEATEGTYGDPDEKVKLIKMEKDESIRVETEYKDESPKNLKYVVDDEPSNRGVRKLELELGGPIVSEVKENVDDVEDEDPSDESEEEFLELEEDDEGNDEVSKHYVDGDE